MTKSQTPRVQTKSTKKRNLKASADDSSDGQNEKIKQMKVKTTEKKADTEDCEVNVQNDGLKPKKAQRKEKKKTESTEKIKMQRKRKAESSGDQELEDEDGSDGMEDLTPEEKRVLERKLKKIRKKEEKKNMKAAVSATQEENKTNVAEKLALEYLTCWSERKDEWKFQKTRQTWLLQNMYDSEKVPDRYFKVLLAYLEGLKGTAKEKTLQKAEALVRWEGQGDEDAEVEEKKKYRAKIIMQQL